MSYRSFKRVLGETSLERKCRFLFGACLLLLITGSFWLYGKQTEKLVFKQNPTKGRLLVDKTVSEKHWEYFKTADEVPPAGDARATGGRLPEEMPRLNRLLELIGKELSQEPYRWTFIRPDAAIGSRVPKDKFERDLLAAFLAGTADKDWNHRTTREERGDYVYYQAIRATRESCEYCHTPIDAGPSRSGYRPAATAASGPAPLLGVMEVTISDEETQLDLSWNRAILLATAIMTVFLAMIAAYIIVRYVIVKPLKHLRDISDAISHGNHELRADIRTGDEFEQLGLAFNRMLRHLVAAQEELRHANISLDQKVDQLAQLNMRLFELNRLKSDFLATMSHELRTPLNSILGFSDVLAQIKSLDDKQRRYVHNIQHSGRMLLDMINDVLDLAKIESGRADFRLSDFPIEHIVHAQCDMARPLAEKRHIDLDVELEPGLPALHQDAGKVQQVLNNLLSNAIKFTPDGGRIVVRARKADDRLELVVSDTGVGISEEDQQFIFEKFRQGRIVLPAGDAMTREYSGTGLGLSIVKELCKLLGGEVHLQSQLGQGSTFTVRLPWRLAHEPAPLAPLAEELDQLARAGLSSAAALTAGHHAP